MSNSFLCPQTPPRVTRSKLSNIFTTPAKHLETSHKLLTPCTSTKKAPAIQFKTPSSIVKKSTILPTKDNASLLPLTPDFTPQHSPNRSQRKRKVFPDDIFKHATNSSTTLSEKLTFGLLLPSPSTVGSGRKAINKLRLSNPIDGSKSNKLNQMAILNEGINFEEDIDDEIDATATKEPLTPSIQIINDDLVDHWHGKSYNNQFSSDEELSDTELQVKELHNPFMDSSSSKIEKGTTKRGSNPFQDTFGSPKDEIDYRTHMELVNGKTGIKRVVKLTSRQSKMVPKKLDFSSC